MFILTQYILKNSLFKNSPNLSIYTIVIGIVIYSVFYLYFMMYNRELLPYFNNIIIYILGVDLLISAFYFQQSSTGDDCANLEEPKTDIHEEYNYTINNNENPDDSKSDDTCVLSNNESDNNSDNESDNNSDNESDNNSDNESNNNSDNDSNLESDDDMEINHGMSNNIMEINHGMSNNIMEMKHDDIEINHGMSNNIMEIKHDEIKYQEFKNMIEMNKIKDSYEYTDDNSNDNSNIVPVKKRGRGRPKKE